MVDIIIPMYNARDTLPALLDSLVAQTNKRFLVTLSQDGDNEDYSDIIQTYEDRGLHIRLIKSLENTGPGGARQRAMDADKQSEFFMFCDADDLLMPRAVEILSREIQVTGADIITSDFIAERQHTPGRYLRAADIPVTWMHGKIYRAAYLRRIGLRFIDGLRLNEDSYFNLVACNCTTNKRIVPEVTYIWRDNPHSLTREDDNFYFKGWLYYLTSQAKGIESIIEITQDVKVDLLAATLINIYDEMMPAVHLGLSLNEAADILAPFKTWDIVQQKINSLDFWQYIAAHVRACNFFNDNLIFYKMRFIDWMNMFIISKKEVQEENA